MNRSPIELAIDLVGLQPLAKRLGVTYQAIRKWCASGVPPDRVIAVCEATHWKVTPHMLRPDIYPNPADALPTGLTIIAETPLPKVIPPLSEPIHECASGDPRYHPDRRQFDKRQTERRHPDKRQAPRRKDTA